MSDGGDKSRSYVDRFPSYEERNVVSDGGGCLAITAIVVVVACGVVTCLSWKSHEDKQPFVDAVRIKVTDCLNGKASPDSSAFDYFRTHDFPGDCSPNAIISSSGILNGTGYTPDDINLNTDYLFNLISEGRLSKCLIEKYGSIYESVFKNPNLVGGESVQSCVSEDFKLDRVRSCFPPNFSKDLVDTCLANLRPVVESGLLANGYDMKQLVTRLKELDLSDGDISESSDDDTLELLVGAYVVHQIFIADDDDEY